EYVDTEYSLWLTWFLMPVIVTFLLPAVIIVLIYISAIIFHLYRLYRMNVVDGVQPDWKHAARLAVCALWDAHGWLWHGYDIKGLENIPDGPFLVIYYHGALPIDMYYFIARWATLLEGLCVIPGTVQTCASVLRNGNPLAISPGGVYEAQFGDHYYRLNWRNRIGFAKVAHAIEDLVEEHQRIPGSILQALLERVHEIPKRRKEPPLTNGKCQNGTLKSTEDSEKSASGKSKVS
ncbi:hypothetical protein HF086_008548, partial [Spodoptera exigua]